MRSDMEKMMERIIALVKDKKDLSDEEINKIVEKMRKEDDQKCEKPRLIFNDRAATIVFPSGFSVAVDRLGNIQWHYDGRSVAEGTVTPIVDQHTMELCVKHVIGLHIAEKEELEKRLLQPTKNDDKVKHRYMNKDKKRAFVSGMILGKKEAGN